MVCKNEPKGRHTKYVEGRYKCRVGRRNVCMGHVKSTMQCKKAVATIHNRWGLGNKQKRRVVVAATR